jgi:hypothetical protein
LLKLLNFYCRSVTVTTLVITPQVAREESPGLIGVPGPTMNLGQLGEQMGLPGQLVRACVNVDRLPDPSRILRRPRPRAELTQRRLGVGLCGYDSGQGEGSQDKPNSTRQFSFTLG